MAPNIISLNDYGKKINNINIIVSALHTQCLVETCTSIIVILCSAVCVRACICLCPCACVCTCFPPSCCLPYAAIDLAGGSVYLDYLLTIKQYKQPFSTFEEAVKDGLLPDRVCPDTDNESM